jgi:hypothetical protein
MKITLTKSEVIEIVTQYMKNNMGINGEVKGDTLDGLYAELTIANAKEVKPEQEEIKKEEEKEVVKEEPPKKDQPVTIASIFS